MGLLGGVANNFMKIPGKRRKMQSLIHYVGQIIKGQLCSVLRTDKRYPIRIFSLSRAYSFNREELRTEGIFVFSSKAAATAIK